MSRAIQEPARVAIIGAGTIGVGWAVVFAQAAHSVSLHDVDPERLTAARWEIADRLTKLASFDLIEETPATIGLRIEASTNLGRTVEDAGYVQECVPEALALKRDVFRSLDASADPKRYSRARHRQSACRRSRPICRAANAAWSCIPATRRTCFGWLRSYRPGSPVTRP